MNLTDIQPYVQDIADAIASVLKLEVEIANQYFIRIAGTGENKSGVLRKMEGDFVYQSAIRTGSPVVIASPGHEDVCRRCSFYQNCAETGEICLPITYEDRPIGVIGLLAFNEEQRLRLFENTDDILTFLDKMAGLLASKLHEHDMMQKMKNNSVKMSKIMNLVEQGIIVMDNHETLYDMNAKAKAILNIKNEQHMAKRVNNLIEQLNMERSSERTIIHLDIDGEEKSLFVSRQKLVELHNFEEQLIIVQAVDELQYLTEQAAEVKQRSFDQIIGNSPQIKEVKEYAFKASQTHSSILILGESGTGKEEFAKAIHRASRRNKKPFITVNLGAIPENLLESELFGYEKGAFTGANQAGKPGKFELADGGTIFLDEIAEMTPHMQVKLLRVLQAKEIERLGGTTSKKIDVRVIAATNKNIQSMVEQNLFREDLFFRLNVIPIMLPALRSRREDILVLADYFIQYFNEQFQAQVIGMAQEVKEMMLQYPWKGNVRELRNFIEYLFNFIQEGWITLKNSEPYLYQKLNIAQNEPYVNEPDFSLERIEKETVEQAIQYVKQQQLPLDEACDLLGIGRATLYRKIKKYHIDT